MGLGWISNAVRTEGVVWRGGRQPPVLPSPSMAKIVLTCWGSHGDVDPFVGLALGLQARGHEVSVATLEYFRSVITQSGLDFHPIRPKADPSDTALVQRLMDRNRGPEYLLREIIFPGVEAMYEDLGAAIQGADLLISHPLTVAAPILAEERGLPWASTVLAPASFFSVHDLPVLPPAPWLKHLERLGPWVARGLVGLAKGSTARWALPVAALRAKRGLPPGRTPIFDGQHSPHLVLALYSSVLGKPQADWPPNVVVTGHMFHDRAHGVALTPEVEAFLSAGPAPLVFTLGSSAVLVAGPFWDESVTAVEKLGARPMIIWVIAWPGFGMVTMSRPAMPGAARMGSGVRKASSRTVAPPTASRRASTTSS